MFDFLSKIYNMYDDRRSVGVIYLDFQKPFDKVRHNRLLSAHVHGITGNALRWLKDYLKDISSELL